MADNLFPAGYDAEIAAPGEPAGSAPTGYRNGILFDYAAGDFPRDGRNRLQDSTGIESWQSWIENCLVTERYKHAAYSTDFGLELDAVFHSASRSEAESILTRQITEALLADPYGRTQYIENITFNWAGADSVEATVTAHGLDDVTIDTTAYITKGGA